MLHAWESLTRRNVDAREGPGSPGGLGKECGASGGRRGLASWSLRGGMASPCCGPPPAAAATREPRPWRRAPRARAAWLCEERRGWTAAARAPLRGGRGPASASLPARRWPEASGLRHHPRSPGKGEWRATCSPQLPPPYPLPSILERGREATRGLPSLRATRKPLTAGPHRNAEPEKLSARRVSRKSELYCGGIYYSARVQDGGEL